jgi:hypothetical protein
MSATVLPSVFGAIVIEAALGFSSDSTFERGVGNITDGARAADQIFARLLWELIDDAQTVTWNNINNSQADTWGAVNTSQADAWSNINNSQTDSWGAVNTSQTDAWQIVQTQT